MNTPSKEKIEAFLKKAGFWKLSGKDVWCESKVPNQKVCDLTKEPPWIGISTGVGRTEAEDSGIALIQDYKSMILQIYNSSQIQDKKSPEAAHIQAAPPQEQKVEVSYLPPMNGTSTILAVPATSGDESYPFICSKCKNGISAKQRADTVKAMGKALCKLCIIYYPVLVEENTPDPKPEPVKETKKKSAGKKEKTPVPEAPIEEPLLDEVVVDGSVNQALQTKATTVEQVSKIVLHWSKGDQIQARRCIAEVISQLSNAGVEKWGAEPIAPVMCKDCGLELSHIRALEYLICESCAEKRKVEAEKIIPLKSREAIKEKIMNEKTESKDIVPAGKGANAPAVISDHERDQIIEKAKAKRFLTNQGGSYSVNGNEVPDSARIQQIANEENISVMILESEQNEDFARVRVRGILGGQSVDDEVWVDFDTELKLLMMEFIRKNEGVLDHFDGLNPVFKEGAKIKNFDGSFTDAKYALVHAMLTLRKFAVRSAGTKASKRVQMKLMNKEFREKEEIADEQAEQDLVSKKRKQ